MITIPRSGWLTVGLMGGSRFCGKPIFTREHGNSGSTWLTLNWLNFYVQFQTFSDFERERRAAA
jgi:hypothetical protein